MKLKNVLLLGLSFVLVAALAVGGTLAYLTSTDSEVNVMTLGNVEIVQHEQQLADDGVALEPFEQAKGIYPGTDVSKIVTVENTGKSDVYFRTLIAFEDLPNSETFDISFPIGEFSGYTWSWGAPAATIAIDGVTYQVYEACYNSVLTPGETSPASLTKVEFDTTCTNEDMEALGDTYDILVLSQAVQIEGFADAKTALNTAFGETNAVNAAKWFDGMIVPVYAEDAEQVLKILENGGELFLQEDISADNYTVNEGVKVDVDLQDNTLSGIVNNKGEMNVSSGKMEANYINNYGDVTFSDVEIKAGTPNDYAIISSNAAAKTTFNNVNIVSAGGGIGVAGGAKVVFNSGNVYVDTASTSGRYCFYLVGNGSTLTINGGSFSWDKNDNQKRAYIYAGEGTTVYVNGGTFGKASTRSDYTDGILGSGTVIITGGTFGFDPSAWVADGYEAVNSDNTWTVCAK